MTTFEKQLPICIAICLFNLHLGQMPSKSSIYLSKQAYLTAIVKSHKISFKIV